MPFDANIVDCMWSCRNVQHVYSYSSRGCGKKWFNCCCKSITNKKILCRFRSKTPLTLKKQQNNTHVNTFTAFNLFFFDGFACLLVEGIYNRLKGKTIWSMESVTSWVGGGKILRQKKNQIICRVLIEFRRNFQNLDSNSSRTRPLH